MNALKTLSAFLLLVLLLASAAEVRAQGSVAPNGQAGVGITTDGMGTFQYAITPSVIAGLGIAFRTQSQDSVSASSWAIVPFVRLLAEGVVNPYLQLGVSIAQDASEVNNSDFFVLVGLQYFINPNVGVHAAFTALDIEFDPSPTTTVFGFTGGMAGLEWYFSR